MISKFYKLAFPRLLICFSLITLTLSPCNCFAESSVPEKNDNEAHSCCDESKSDEKSDKHQGCDNCTECMISSSCSSDSAFIEITSNTLEAENKTVSKVLVVSWLPTIETASNNINYTTGPPGFTSLSSSTRASLLQRWLI